MPTRFEQAVVTCAASVPESNPTVVPLGFGGGIVMVIRIVIPDGHAGLTGIALGYGGNAVVPYGDGAYYTGNDREVILEYVDNVPGVQWQAFLCNLDLQPHSWEVDFDLVEVGATNTTTTIAPVTPASIVAAGVAAMNGP